MYKAYKTELDPNNHQVAYFKQCAGTARFVYNWALADRIATYEATGKSGSQYEQCKRFNSIKREIAPWIVDYPYAVQKYAFTNLDKAYKNFFRRIKKGDKPGFPKFKSRYKTMPSFTLDGSVYADNKSIRLPKMGDIRLKERNYLPIDAEVVNATVTERAGKWFVSMLVKFPDIEPMVSDNGKSLGIDMGIKTLAICSNGKVFKNSKCLDKHDRKIKRLQRELSRRQKGGSNYQKTKTKLSKANYLLAREREFALHKVSKYIATCHYKQIVIEDLNVSGMVKNHHLARSVSDASFGELRRQIEYKCARTGVEVVIANRFYPSSKKCSGCGSIKSNLRLSDRRYICETCGMIEDRDMNAAINLARYEPANGGGLPVELECCNASP